MKLPLTEAEARASERAGERSCAFTCRDSTDSLATLAEALADVKVTRFLVEKTSEGLFTVVYRKGSESFVPPYLDSEA